MGSLFFGVFFSLLLFNLSVLVNISGFFGSSFFLVDLVKGFKSVLGGLINILPHLRDDFGEFGDWGVGVISLDFGVDFFSVEEKGGEGSLGGSRLNK